MKKIIKVVLCCSLSAVFMMGCAAKPTVSVIEPMEAEVANAVSFDLIGGKNVMPIAGFYGPYVATYSENGQVPPVYNTDEYWQMIAECGINVIAASFMDYATYPGEVMKSLDFGEKYNIAVVVKDSEVLRMGEQEISMEALTQRMAKYINHPAFAGLYIVDEPCTEYYKPAGQDAPTRYLNYYHTIAPILNQKLDLLNYSNAYPSGDASPDYERYLNDFVDTLQPKYLSFDRYPFDAAQAGRMDLYFHDLAAVRKVAQENNIPFWSYIQAGSQWNDDYSFFDSVTPYYPNEGQMDWSVNVSLAFGAQGINYFPLIQPYYFAYAKSTPFDFERNGLIGAWGNKNQWYYYAQNMSKHIRTIDEVLMNAVNKGVLACGTQAEKDVSRAKQFGAVLEGTSWRELQSVDGDALIGCFNYQGKTALYVVNYSTEYSQKIILSFQNECRIIAMQNADTKHYQGTSLELDMLPGEGVLLVIQ